MLLRWTEDIKFFFIANDKKSLNAIIFNEYMFLAS